MGGAYIGDYAAVREYIRPDDFVVCCDGGLMHREGLGLTPDLIVGDFDSHENPMLNIETITLPREKDDTDSVFGVRTAVERGYRDFLLVGVTGGRLDHTLGNLSILLKLDSLGCRALIVDDDSDMEIVSKDAATITDHYAGFSVFCTGEEATGITITGAKYLLDNGRISCEYQYGISNEVLPGKEAVISVKEGRLLLIRLRRI